MLSNDYFSRWMDINNFKIGLGTCEFKCTVKKEMLNGFGILHGGITYSLSDSALAFASNSYGFQCVSVETSISHLKTVKENDVLHVITSEISRGKTLGIYSISIFNQDKQLVSKFKGTVHISVKSW